MTRALGISLPMNLWINLCLSLGLLVATGCVPGLIDPASQDAGLADAGSSDHNEVDSGCAPFTGSCDEVERSTSAHHIQTLDSCAFALSAPVTDNDSLIDALVTRAGGALGIAEILEDLDHQAQSGISSTNAAHLQGQTWQGFRWDSDDVSDSAWYPQGISSSSDADASGLVNGTHAMLVSWYNKTNARPTQGARISLANVDDLGAVTYRHLLLVEPFDNDGSPDFGPAHYDSGDHDALHVGGIVWYGDYLYVADTFAGLRVFDLSRIIRMTHTDQPNSIGVSADRIDAHGYQYAVPQLARYVLSADSCSVRFSFAGLDRSVIPHRIVTGEFHDADVNGRLVAWPLDASTGLLAAQAGEVRGMAAYVSGQSQMQGALSIDGEIYISSSDQDTGFYGRLYRTQPGLESSSTPWLLGCEDLLYEASSDSIWTLSEFPGARDIVGVARELP